jgi:hypothetical protein
MNILPELSDGLNLLLDALVKSSFVIEKQPPQVTRKNKQKYLSFYFKIYSYVLILSAGSENQHQI